MSAAWWAPLLSVVLLGELTLIGLWCTEVRPARGRGTGWWSR